MWLPELDQRGKSGELAVLEGLEEFREHLGGRMTITLPKSIGAKIDVHHMDVDFLEEGVLYLRNYNAESREVS